ncbi:ribonuclease H-like protein [Aspergillus lucknowensis]|uniref:ribonuclease H n=1 Tax=Aspergillus lucknowensis TaxID=176173 RepID=A0ABR4LHX2_9EURO
MVYKMEIYTDGGCRGNGKPWAYGAAAAVVKNKWGRHTRRRTVELPEGQDPRPSNQRAEIMGIILGLQLALEKRQEVHPRTKFSVRIYSDSRYAIGCMTEWIYKWVQNDWTNAAGREVVNRDLIEEASDLDDDLNAVGRVRFIYIPREDNEVADELCNDCMDDM